MFLSRGVPSQGPFRVSCPGAFRVIHPISPSKFEAKQKKNLVKLLNIETK